MSSICTFYGEICLVSLGDIQFQGHPLWTWPIAHVATSQNPPGPAFYRPLYKAE